MNRRLILLLVAIIATNILSVGASENFRKRADSLLTVWCDGMIDWQTTEPHDSEVDGCLYCEACDKIHGRCMDAVYPFMYMYNKSHDKRYLDAAISVMEWSKNVSAPDGSWTVIPNPKSWKGITVFGAVSLAETLKHYGDLLPEQTKLAWDDRLRSAAEYIYNTFTLTFTNINYGVSAIYAMYLIGDYLDEPRYLEKSRELLTDIEVCFTAENGLLYGEGKPYDKLSGKGLHAVDLGYNVEETLNALALYAVDAQDSQIMALAVKSLRSHLEFMLPDGGWDNSWGTRQYKWSYWGSRTTEGCFPGYGVLSSEEPIFAEAVARNMELLERCTDPKYGLISGGIHYHSHGVMPCIHHTFTHAKALASLLDRDLDFDLFDREQTLPRDIESGVKHFPEIDTWLVASGDWRATVSNYDLLYHKDAQQATGGSVALLYHKRVGALLTASLAKYTLIEANNQQENPGVELALTPRVEVVADGDVYSNLYDYDAEVECVQKSDKYLRFNVENILKDSDYESTDGGIESSVSYVFRGDDTFEYSVSRLDGVSKGDTAELILPIVCSSEERAEQRSPKEIRIYKDGGVVVVSSNSPLLLKTDINERIFNMVPGVEVLPIYTILDKKAVVKIEVL